MSVKSGQNVKGNTGEFMEKNNLSLNEALEICKAWGLSVTASGLLYAARQHGFMEKASDDFHYKYKRKGLIEYIKNASGEVPEGWITIREAAELTKKSIGTIYYHIQKKELIAKQLGRNRLYYIEKDQMERFFKEKIDERKER